MSTLTDREYQIWQWMWNRWQPIAYRTKKVLHKILCADDNDWYAYGEGKDLRFERLIDFDKGSWPFDREVIKVEFDHLGRLKGCQRYKIINIEHGRSHADLCRMLGIEE